MTKGFFIGEGCISGGSDSGGNGGNIKVDNGDVIVNTPLNLYIDDSNNVYAGRNTKDNNATLIYVHEDAIYARKVS